MLRRLELHDMDRAASVLRVSFDQAFPTLARLHTPSATKRHRTVRENFPALRSVAGPARHTVRGAQLQIALETQALFVAFSSLRHRDDELGKLCMP